MDLMRGATGVAAVAAIGNFLQGWDGGAIAGKRSNTQTKALTSPAFNHILFQATASILRRKTLQIWSFSSIEFLSC